MSLQRAPMNTRGPSILVSLLVASDVVGHFGFERLGEYPPGSLRCARASSRTIRTAWRLRQKNQKLLQEQGKE